MKPGDFDDILTMEELPSEKKKKKERKKKKKRRKRKKKPKEEDLLDVNPLLLLPTHPSIFSTNTKTGSSRKIIDGNGFYPRIRGFRRCPIG